MLTVVREARERARAAAHQDEQDELRKLVAAQRKQTADAKATAERRKAAEKARKDAQMAKQRAEKKRAEIGPSKFHFQLLSRRQHSERKTRQW